MATGRLGVLLVLGLAAVAGGCRDHTVDLGFRPEQGDSYVYRYEITATITRALDGEAPEVTRVDTVLLVEQEVLDPTADGARVQVELRRDGGEPRSAVVVLDRAGSLQGIEAVEGLPAEAMTAGGTSLVEPASLPEARLAPGQRWEIDDETHVVRGRLERLGIIDGEEVAVVRATTHDEVREEVDAGGSVARLDGTVSAQSTTSYDLGDGAIRRSQTSSLGTLAVEIAPPSGVAAEPVPGEIRYDVRVKVTRVG